MKNGMIGVAALKTIISRRVVDFSLFAWRGGSL
jgi:hypothetical protein